MGGGRESGEDSGISEAKTTVGEGNRKRGPIRF